MQFFSKASNLRVQLAEGGWMPNPTNPTMYNPVSGDYAQFEGGRFDTAKHVSQMTEEDMVTKLRKHPDYGYGRVFWAEIDRPESERVEEELARLRAENAAYRQMNGPRVVVVKEAAPAPAPDPTVVPDAETGLQRLNRIKKQANALGISGQTGWKAEDYERAIAEKE